MGEVFAGRYELVDPLGEGAGGRVWRVHDRVQDAFVAAKVLRQVDATSMLRFLREQAVRIDHRHVMTPLGWAGEDDRVLFTMPIATGGSVATLVGDYGPLPLPWVLTLLDQVLQGLVEIHGRGIVHRDLKPANMLLDATGTDTPRLRLSDFGVAVALGEPRLTHGPTALGAPGYLAPEPGRRRPPPTGRSVCRGDQCAGDDHRCRTRSAAPRARRPWAAGRRWACPQR